MSLLPLRGSPHAWCLLPSGLEEVGEAPQVAGLTESRASSTLLLRDRKGVVCSPGGAKRNEA